jgi:hypothetical protein
MKSDSTNACDGFKTVFSADCPPISPGSGSIGSSIDTVFGSSAHFTCPNRMVFATGVAEITTYC